jgi:hypothetical protein
MTVAMLGSAVFYFRAIITISGLAGHSATRHECPRAFV